MKVSRTWLQKHFAEPLPDTAQLAELFTFHAFEVEGHDEDMIDLKVLPDRAGYALSHRGIAAELSAILGIPMSYDQFAEALPSYPSGEGLALTLDGAFVSRHIGAIVRGVAVGPSPAWLSEALASVGQRSINNVVDATNLVMLAVGQPNHAFDLAALTKGPRGYEIAIRAAKEGEKVATLSDEEYALTSDMHVIADAVSGTALDIAGIKGGKASGVSEVTTDLFVSVGNYDATRVRKTAQTLKLFTDASLRYQNRPPTELVGYGAHQLFSLLTQVCGGTLEVVVDETCVMTPERAPLAVTTAALNARLGTAYTDAEVASVLSRLSLPYLQEGSGAFMVSVPFWRRDLLVPEDLAEEVGRILGYDRIEGALLPVAAPGDTARYRGIESVRDFLVARGFTEVSTPSFAVSGDILLANPLDQTRPYLRATLNGNLADALSRASLAAPTLGVYDEVRLFEIGTTFTKDGEQLMVSLGRKRVSGKAGDLLAEDIAALAASFGITSVRQGDVAEGVLGSLPGSDGIGVSSLGAFVPYSAYPFALRDIAAWTPEGTPLETVHALIREHAGAELLRADHFDSFTKEGRTSHAFHLVFQSPERTLTEEDLTAAMASVEAAIRALEGWEVR